MSLYRVYRPKTFSDVAGQEAIVSTLQQAIAQDKLAHAYLFAGTRGTGKTTIARIMAKAILTHGMQDETLKRQVIEAVEDGSLVDLTEIDAASNRGIDDIRSLLEKIQFTPVVAKAKVFIIDEVHMLTREAFNALLKTLEEPPAYAYFILATTEIHKIPATIQSRCQRFLFRQIGIEDIVGRLKYIAAQEKIDIDEEALAAIARHVGGSMRDAVSLLDQLRSLPTVTIEDIRQRIGESGHAHVAQMMDALAGGDRAEILRIIRELEATAVPMETFLRMLLSEARTRLHGAIERGMETQTSLQLMDALLEAAKDVRIAPVPGLVVESALLSLCPTDGTPMPAPAKKAPAPPAPTPPPVAKPVEAAPAPPAAQPAPQAATAKAEEPVAAGDISLTDVLKAWPAIVDEAQPPFVRMSLKNGQPVDVQGNTIVVRFTSTFHKDKASSAESGSSIEDAIKKTLGAPLKVKFTMDADGPTPKAPAGESVNLAEAALDVF